MGAPSTLADIRIGCRRIDRNLRMMNCEQFANPVSSGDDVEPDSVELNGRVVVGQVPLFLPCPACALVAYAVGLVKTSHLRRRLQRQYPLLRLFVDVPFDSCGDVRDAAKPVSLSITRLVSASILPEILSLSSSGLWAPSEMKIQRERGSGRTVRIDSLIVTRQKSDDLMIEYPCCICEVLGHYTEEIPCFRSVRAWIEHHTLNAEL